MSETKLSKKSGKNSKFRKLCNHHFVTVMNNAMHKIQAAVINENPVQCSKHVLLCSYPETRANGRLQAESLTGLTKQKFNPD